MSYLYRYLLSERESLLLMGALVDWLSVNENEEVEAITKYIVSDFELQFGKVNRKGNQPRPLLREALNEVIQKHSKQNAQ